LDLFGREIEKEEARGGGTKGGERRRRESISGIDFFSLQT